MGKSMTELNRILYPILLRCMWTHTHQCRVFFCPGQMFDELGLGLSLASYKNKRRKQQRMTCFIVGRRKTILSVCLSVSLSIWVLFKTKKTFSKPVLHRWKNNNGHWTYGIKETEVRTGLLHDLVHYPVLTDTSGLFPTDPSLMWGLTVWKDGHLQNRS